MAAIITGKDDEAALYLRERRIFLLLLFILLLSSCVTSPEKSFRRRVVQEWKPIWEPVARGVAYAHFSEDAGLPRVHLLRIDLQASSLELFVPPPFEEGRDPLQYWRELEGEGRFPLALWNGSPFRFTRPLGRGRMVPVSIWVSDGTTYSKQERDWGYIAERRDGGIVVDRGASIPASRRGTYRWAVGGFLPILEGGENVGIDGELHARTAMGISAGGTILFLAVVEGERIARPGLSSRETAILLRSAGAWDGLNLDGGGSSFLLLRRSGEELLYYRGSRKRLPCMLGLYLSY